MGLSRNSELNSHSTVIFRLSVVVLVAVLAATAWPGAASAAPGPTVDTLVLGSGDGAVTVTLDSPMSAAEAAAVRRSWAREPDPAAAPDPGPTYPVLKCSVGVYRFNDRSGQAQLRYNCRHDNVNWGYKISRKLRSIATSKVAESGATWYVGHEYRGRNSPHIRSADYHFHGTFSRIADWDLVSWYDTLTFRVRVGGRTGTAVLRIGGAFVVSPH